MHNVFFGGIFALIDLIFSDTQYIANLLFHEDGMFLEGQLPGTFTNQPFILKYLSLLTLHITIQCPAYNT